jgi:uncharacterized protein with von Willebrand factor type A (vWA) domain
MFIEFFYYLKEHLPVSITEFITLLEALNKGLIHDMVEFYYVSRSILCKNEYLFDHYDIAFANFFKGTMLKFPVELRQELLEWLDKNVQVLHLPDSYELFENIDLEDLERQFRLLLREQDEEHNFGDKWIGTQGESQFGNLGQNLMGMRVAGNSGIHRAMLIAQKRIFKDYRKDLVLGTRRIKIALKRLRKLDEIGKRNEFNLDKTIDKTCKNGGDIEIVFDKRRKNNVKLLLLMDVGGTMDPYAHQVNLLFSAANNISHWKSFKHYYFHNCIYDYLYKSASRNKDQAIEFDDFLRNYDNSYHVIIVGDQTMHRSELVNIHGAIYDGATNKKSGIHYIEEIGRHFKNNVIWLNPEANSFEWMSWTRLKISKIIPTLPLTIAGIEKAMDYLRTRGNNHYTSVDFLKDVLLAYF